MQREVGHVLDLRGERRRPQRVDQVQENSAAAEAGLEQGDLIIAIDGKAVETFSDLQRIVSVSADVPLNVTVERGTQTLDLVVTPNRREIRDRFGNVQRVGQLGGVSGSAAPDRTYRERRGFERRGADCAVFGGLADLAGDLLAGVLE